MSHENLTNEIYHIAQEWIKKKKKMQNNKKMKMRQLGNPNCLIHPNQAMDMEGPSFSTSPCIVSCIKESIVKVEPQYFDL